MDLEAEATGLATALAAAIGRSDPAEIARLLEQLSSFSKIVTPEQAQAIPAAVTADLVTMSWAVITAFDATADPTGLVPLAASVFGALLGQMPAAEVLKQPQVAEALRHQALSVRRLGLDQAARAPQQLLSQPELLSGVVALVADGQVSVGAASCRVLSELAATPEGLTTVLAPATTTALLAMANDPTIMVRVLAELYIGIIRASPAAADAVIAAGVFMPLVTLMGSDDVLAKMAVIESLSELANVTGYAVLDKLSVPDRLWDTLANKSDNMDGQLLAPVIVQLFAKLAVIPAGAGAAVLAKYGLLDLIAANIGDRASPLQAACLEAVKTIADAPSGADTLLASERRADGPSIATQLGELAHDSARASQQAAALHVIAAVLTASQDDGEAGGIDARGQLFETVAGGAGSTTAFLRFVMGRGKLPFPETSDAAFAALQAAAGQPWGRHAMLTVPGFYEELINRSNSTPGQRGWKFAIAQRFVRYPDGLGGTQLDHLRKFVAQGPHFRPAVVGGSIMSETA